MELGLRGRAALVTAASKGLGRAAAEALAREGCDVAICARGEDALHATAEDLRALGVRVLARALDISEPDACERFVGETADEFGRLDIVVGNNGGPRAGTIDTTPDDEFRAVLERNLLIMVRLARAALPHMRARSWGRIVFISSISAKNPIDGLIAGNTARAAITGFAKTLSREVAREGITVNTLAPDAIITDRIRELARAGAEAQGITFEEALAGWGQTPMGRAGTPEELGALVAFLASEQASFISGTTIAVDGGNSRALQ